MAVEPPTAFRGSTPMCAEHGVVAKREVEHDPVAVAIFGNVPDSMRSTFSRRKLSGVNAADLDCAARRCASDKRLEKLRLPISFDPGDADDLTGMDFE